MPKKITNEQVNTALEAWQVAYERAAHEEEANSRVLRSHKDLIASMRTAGYSAEKAVYEFDAILAGHNDAISKALEYLNMRCAEYRELRSAFDKQK